MRAENQSDLKNFEVTIRGAVDLSYSKYCSAYKNSQKMPERSPTSPVPQKTFCLEFVVKEMLRQKVLEYKYTGQITFED
jgi:hypothetical protein